jgi:hypothetical protein
MLTTILITISGTSEHHSLPYPFHYKDYFRKVVVMGETCLPFLGDAAAHLPLLQFRRK